MRIQSLSFLLALLGVAACVREAGPTASQWPPASTKAPTPADAKRGEIIGTVVTEPWRSIKDGAVVYIEDAPREPGVGLSTSIDTRDMSLAPHIAVMTAGGTVRLSNSDPIDHAVFSPDDDSFELGTLQQHQSTAVRLDRPAAYTLLCRCHPNMGSYLVVSPSSYFTKADAEGTFVIEGVPKGTYRVTAWAPRFKPETKTVALADDKLAVHFELHR